MNPSLPALIAGARRALTDDVLPQVASDHARTQLAGVLDILAKLERMVVWSPDPLAQQLQVLLHGCQAFAARAAQEGVMLAPYAPPGETGPEPALRAAEAHLMQLTGWLFDPSHPLSDAARTSLDAIVRDTLRQQLLIERKLIPLTDFSAMTAVAPAEP